MNSPTLTPMREKAIAGASEATGVLHDAREIASLIERIPFAVLMKERFGPILLQKYFWGGELKFSEPLMRLAPRDVRDHIVSRQNDHGPSYRCHGASQRQRCLGIDFREIFGVVGFSTFATKSALLRQTGTV